MRNFAKSILRTPIASSLLLLMVPGLSLKRWLALGAFGTAAVAIGIVFALEISLALERGLTYEELEEKVETLEEANVKLKEHQELITKLRAEASIGDMVLQLTHSFKNPVIAIAGLARILKKRAQTDLTETVDMGFDHEDERVVSRCQTTVGCIVAEGRR